MVSPLANSIQFLKDFGLFDVVLPFLLVFTIVFAILEKTKILGEEPDGMPKRTLNSMVGFVAGMLVVAVNKVVYAINQALPNVVLLLVVIVSFLMLIGIFYKEGEFNFAEQHKAWVGFFLFAVFAIIVLIFLDSILVGTTSQTYLEWILEYVIQNISGPIVTSIIFVIIAVGAILYITKAKEAPKKE